MNVLGRPGLPAPLCHCSKAIFCNRNDSLFLRYHAEIPELAHALRREPFWLAKASVLFSVRLSPIVSGQQVPPLLTRHLHAGLELNVRASNILPEDID